MNYKKKEVSVCLRITHHCNHNCPHCYIAASVNNKKGLSKQKIKLALKDLLILNSNFFLIKEIRLTGGEITTMPYITKLIREISDKFPGVILRFETNGINFLKNKNLEKILSLINVLHISIDAWHKNVDRKGKSNILEYFLGKQADNNYQIIVHWATNQHDSNLIKRFLKQYYKRGIKFEFGEVNKEGWAVNLEEKFLAKKLSNRTKCSFGKFLMLDVDGLWYGCRVATKFSLICPIGDKRLGGKLSHLIQKRKLYKVNQFGFPMIKRKLSMFEINELLSRAQGIICDTCQKINR